MASTYEPIAKIDVPTTVSSVEFTSISSSYTDLIIIVNAVGNTGAGLDYYMRLNNDSASNYSRTIISGDGSTITSARQSNQSQIQLGYLQAGMSASGRTNMIIQLMNYGNSTTYKTVLTRANDGASEVSACIGLWRKTPEAITSIKISGDAGFAGNINAGSSFSLYGIKAA
jgi:hypothetical protein